MNHISEVSAIVWIFVSPSNSYVEILILNVMVLGGVAFRRAKPMKGISAFIKEAW